MKNKQTAVEWLAEKYNYITWMRDRDEMSAEAADWYRKDYLEKAKQMEKEQIIDAYTIGSYDMAEKEFRPEQYYNETYGR